MFRNTLNQWTVFYYTVFSGILSGLLYDLLRAFRRLLKAKRVLSAILDVFFWVAAAGIIFFALWQANDGRPQVFAFIGAGLGACVYLVFVSSSVNIFFRSIKRFALMVKYNFLSIVKKKKL